MYVGACASLGGMETCPTMFDEEEDVEECITTIWDLSFLVVYVCLMIFKLCYGDIWTICCLLLKFLFDVCCTLMILIFIWCMSYLKFVDEQFR